MMGARNVSAALLMYPSVTYRAKLALVTMALTALDQPTDNLHARLYFAGIEPIADSLGFPRDAQGELTESARRQVTKALTELRTCGAITPVVRGGRGRRAVYRLELELIAPSTTKTVPLQHDQNGPTQHDQNGPTQHDQNGPPYEEVRNHRGITFEEKITGNLSLTSAREEAA